MPRVTVFTANPGKHYYIVQFWPAMTFSRVFATQAAGVSSLRRWAKQGQGGTLQRGTIRAGKFIADRVIASAAAGQSVKFHQGPITGPGPTLHNVPRRRVAKRARRNPPVRQLGQLVSGNVHQIRYTHVQDGKNYEHKFGANVCAELLDDGSVRLFHAKGKPLMREF